MTADSPRRVRGDLRFLRLYVYTVPTVMRYAPDPACIAESDAADAVLGRVEDGLAGEASRYRAVFASIAGIVLMPGLLAGFLWSGLYWLPVRFLWFPFERGTYGLPFFSLYEWLAFICLAAFFAYTGAVMYTSRLQTRRLTADFRRFIDADSEQRAELAEKTRGGAYPRATLVLRTSSVFAAYRPLVARPADGAAR